jgi:two-component system sensor kinase FixL
MRNAIEAMQDCPRKELVVETALLDHGMVEVRVADTGSGLAEEVVPRLFQPFVTTKPGGMGVGLSISKRIVEAHGGELRAEPNPGGGALFRFTLETSGDLRGSDAG